VLRKANAIATSSILRTITQISVKCGPQFSSSF
jgi:hypothetical protein